MLPTQLSITLNLRFRPNTKRQGKLAPLLPFRLLQKLTVGFGLLLGFRFGLRRIKLGVLAPESVDATGGVDQLLSAGEKRMTGRANVEGKGLADGRASLKLVPASTLDHHLDILGMNLWFHLNHTPKLNHISCILYSESPLLASDSFVQV